MRLGSPGSSAAAKPDSAGIGTRASTAGNSPEADYNQAFALQVGGPVGARSRCFTRSGPGRHILEIPGVGVEGRGRGLDDRIASQLGFRRDDLAAPLHHVGEDAQSCAKGRIST